MPQSPSAEACRRAIASGWISYIEVESLLLETDPRMVSFAFPPLRELLAAFEIPLQWTFGRPRRGWQGGFGIEQMTAVDLAHLLIQLEATGFAIDPAPLCDALRPTLRTRAHLTSAEIAVWWHPKERHRSEPQVIATSPPAAWRAPDQTLTTPTGYRADLFRNDEGAATALMVTAPKWRPSRRARAA